MAAMLKVGFVPSVRNRASMPRWCVQMREQSIAAMQHIDGWQVLAPATSPDGQTRDGLKGCTPAGVGAISMMLMLWRATLPVRASCAGVVPSTGDERSAAKIAERLQVPVLLYATKEPPPSTIGPGARVCSCCGNLSMASALYRRKLPFHYAGLFFPTDPELEAELEAFAGRRWWSEPPAGATHRSSACGRPPETVGYDETAMLLKFGQNVIYTNLADITTAAQALASDDPQVQAVMARLDAVHYGKRPLLLDAARLEVAMAEFWRSNSFLHGAQCWPSVQRMMEILVCHLWRLTNQGLLTACEVDVLGSLAMLTTPPPSVPPCLTLSTGPSSIDDANVLLNLALRQRHQPGCRP